MNNEFLSSKNMQLILRWVMISFIVLSVFLAFEALSVFKDLRKPNPTPNTISVTGEGEVLAVPDTASFSFTISADAKDVSSAQTEVTKKTDDTLKQIKTLGVLDKDIKTTNYSIYPKYTYVSSSLCSVNYCPPGRQVLEGYEVSNTITVKIRKIEDAGKALSIVANSGATNVSNLSFVIDDDKSLQTEARTKAIDDAKAKAKTLSKNLGVSIERVVSYYENNNNNGGPQTYSPEVMMSSKDVGGGSAPTLASGQNTIHSSVTITFEIR